jgi:hypothetical protein
MKRNGKLGSKLSELEFFLKNRADSRPDAMRDGRDALYRCSRTTHAVVVTPSFRESFGEFGGPPQLVKTSLL